MGVRRCVRATNTLPPSSPTGAACNVYVSEGHNTEALEEMQVRVCKRACVHTCVQARQHITTTTCSAPAQQYKEASCPPINLLTLQVCTPRPKQASVRSVPGVHLAHVFVDAPYNRTGFTLTALSAAEVCGFQVCVASLAVLVQNKCACVWRLASS